VAVGSRRGVGGGVGRRRRLDNDRLGVRQLVLLFPLHAAVLEPDLDLALGEAERVRDLDAPAPREVTVEVELLLQLENLMFGVGGARSLAVQTRDAVTSISACTHPHHSACIYSFLFAKSAARQKNKNAKSNKQYIHSRLHLTNLSTHPIPNISYLLVRSQYITVRRNRNCTERR